MNKKHDSSTCKSKSHGSSKQSASKRASASSALVFDNLGEGDDGLQNPHDQEAVRKLDRYRDT